MVFSGKFDQIYHEIESNNKMLLCNALREYLQQDIHRFVAPTQLILNIRPRKKFPPDYIALHLRRGDF